MEVYPDEHQENRLRFAEWHAALIRDPVRRLRYLRRTAGLSPRVPPRRRRNRQIRAGAMLALLLVLPLPSGPDASPHGARRKPGSAGNPAPPEVWLVERTSGFETYSNGLRIENLYAVTSQPRSYLAVPRHAAGLGVLQPRTAPAGIVYHTTESHLADFEESRNGELKAASLGLIGYVRKRRSYHFVIDRFGRVHRVAEEPGPANHAGWSVWADRDWIYLNLNDSFLAIAFEAKHRAGDASPSVNTAQLHAGRVLTEMLRARYGIPAYNCVTHAQVSVNPDNRRIGYHTDWSVNFPFRQMGLPDNYEQPLASVREFGFEADPPFIDSTAAGLSRELRSALQEAQWEAASRGMPLTQYRSLLQRRYRELITRVKTADEERENNL